jgi:hypothetical protein
MAVFQTTMKLRRGVTLLEVLVSIGVTSVGLLGVLALIPLGGAQTRQGQVAERCAVVGPSAFSEIRNRDMLSPINWIEGDGIKPVSNTGPQSFCIDPQAVALSSGAKMTLPGLVAANAKMNRFSLWNGGLGPPDATPNLNKIYSKAMAQSIFSSQDDLRLQVSETDRTLPPVQLFNRSTTGSTADPSRRQAEGTMSWMLTAFPNRARSSPADLFTVSIVVFNRRVIDPALKTEFTANVTSFPGGGVAGGDIVIDFTDPTLGYSSDDILEAKIPENSWVLLSGKAGTLNVFEWYRVLAVDGTSPSVRQVSLAGPDWNTAITGPQLTVIPGTMAVYQRNVQLETGLSDGAGATLWRN